MNNLAFDRSRYQPSERRRHPRTQLNMTLHGIRMDPDDGDIKDTLQMVDISRGGMGAVCERSLYPGQRILLCLPMHPEGQRKKVYATVRRCRKIDEGFHVGLQFDNVCLSADAMHDPMAAAA